MAPKRSARGPASCPDALLDVAQHIEMICTNPKKRGTLSFERYEKYKRAKTIGEAQAAGALLGDLKHDYEKGFLRLKSSSAAAAAGPAASATFGAPGRRGAGTTSRSLDNWGPGQRLGAGPGPPTNFGSSLLARLQGRGVLTHLSTDRLAGLSGGSSSSSSGGVIPAAATQAGGLQPEQHVQPPSFPDWHVQGLRSSQPVAPHPEQPALHAAVGAFASAGSVGLLPCISTGLRSGSFGSKSHVGRGPGQVPPATLAPDVAQACEGDAGSTDVEEDEDDFFLEASFAADAALQATNDAAGSSAFGAGTPAAAAFTPGPVASVPVALFSSLDSKPDAAASVGSGRHPAADACRSDDEELDDFLEGMSDGLLLPIEEDAPERQESRCEDVAGAADASASEASAATAQPHHRAWSLPPPSAEGVEQSGRVEDQVKAGDEEEGDTITLRFRLGIVAVKLEPAEGQQQPQHQAQADVARAGGSTSEAAAAAGSAATSIAGPAAAPVSERPSGSGDIRQLLGAQRTSSGPEGANPDIPQELSAEELAERLEAAQVASYEDTANDRQRREVRDGEQVRDGNLEPLEALDQDFMSLVYNSGDGMFVWLESEQNRSLLFRYLKLKARAVKWYQQPAEVYFANLDERIHVLMQSEDAVTSVSSLMQEETDKVEAEVLSMPEKGFFMPQLFAAHASGANDFRSVGDGGCVELD